MNNSAVDLHDSVETSDSISTSALPVPGGVDRRRTVKMSFYSALIIRREWINDVGCACRLKLPGDVLTAGTGDKLELIFFLANFFVNVIAPPDEFIIILRNNKKCCKVR